MEDAAAQDDFLRNAWAGYQANAEADHGAKLASLRERLAGQQPQQAKSRVLRPWMRIAAAVALLLTAGWFVFQNPIANEDVLAKSESAAPTEEPVEQKNETSVDKDVTTTEQEKELSEEVTTVGDIAANATNPDGFISAPANSSDYSYTTNTNESLAEDDSDAAAAFAMDDQAQHSVGISLDNAAADIDVDKKIEPEPIVLDGVAIADEEIVTASPPPPPPATAVDAYRTQNQAPPPVRLEDRYSTSNAGFKLPNPGYRIIQGYVTDSEGNPLIGASILEQGSANGTVTDIDGYYELTVSEQSQNLSVSYTGYQTNEVAIGENEEVSVVLDEGQALDEVVVTGLGKRRDRQSYQTQAVEESGQAKPVGGFSDLRQYIKDNATANAGRANVKMRFYVQADGRPANFSIISSTNPSLNTEAIRLIESGPNWEITSGTAPLEVVYTVKFR